MTELYLIRHGEVHGNTGEPRYVGWSDPPLTDRGEAQAAAAGELLRAAPLTAVYSSDLQRALHTAAAVARPHHLMVAIDEGLREFNYGQWEGLSVGEIEDRWPGLLAAREARPVETAVPGGENVAAAWERWSAALAPLVERHAGQAVAIISHHLVIRLGLCHVLGAPLSYYRRIKLSNCGVSKVSLRDLHDPTTARIHYINEEQHVRGTV